MTKLLGIIVLSTALMATIVVADDTEELDLPWLDQRGISPDQLEKRQEFPHDGSHLYKCQEVVQGFYPCCSIFGWCGNAEDHCDKYVHKDYRNYRKDGRCGPDFKAPNGEEAVCYGEYPCCSTYGWCGNTDDHCVKHLYKDYRNYRDDMRCGPDYKAPNGEEAICYGLYPCCSTYGWCGKTDKHCETEVYKDYRNYRDDLRCGPDYLAPNGDEAICHGLYP